MNYSKIKYVTTTTIFFLNNTLLGHLRIVRLRMSFLVKTCFIVFGTSIKYNDNQGAVASFLTIAKY